MKKKYGPKERTDDQHLFGIRKSIFRPWDTLEEKDKRTNWIHHIFKKKLIYPGMKLLGWCMKKFLHKWVVQERSQIPDEPYNANMLILWDAFEEGVKDWHFNFYRQRKRPNGEIINQEAMDKQWADRLNQHWYVIPKQMLQVVMTIYLEDTAYREQMNCIMFRIQEKMNKRWNPKKQTKFPMYTNMYDMEAAYFLEWLKQSGFSGQVAVNINNDAAKKAINEANKHGEEKTSTMEIGEGVNLGNKRAATGDNNGKTP